MHDRRLRTFIVDAFADTPFKGNPAGVCLVERPLRDAQMRQVAQELNLSETAFVGPGDRSGVRSIRFFSPKMEIPLCGHATLASAKIVFSVDDVAEACFVNRNGLRLAARISGGRIEMEFPV